MKLKSLILNNNRLEIADVEIEFIPGIPQIHFLGLPDRIIKESFYRIKSSLKNAGYKFPLTNQMIVNIKPSHLRKSSRGVEFAVALGILLKTEQIPIETIDLNWILYGELGLDGQIYEPSDLTNEVMNFKDEIFLTGVKSADEQRPHGNIFRLENLKSIEVDRRISPTNGSSFKRPAAGFYRKYSPDEAEFIFLSGTTGLHSLLAGDAGAGKSTLAKSLIGFTKTPGDDERIRFDQNWRPLVNPHQSITPAAFLGGGAYLYEGEIERAQGGILFLDEFLEFNPEIMESLRGPMTGETLRLARGPSHREIHPDFQVVATTNLCRCGKWTPQKQNVGCRFSRIKCVQYLERLSGPLVDRFGLLFFVSRVPVRSVESTDILNRIQTIEKQIDRADFQKDDDLIQTYYASLSTRRKNYLQKVGRIFALERVLNSQRGVALPDKLSIQMTFQDYHRAERWVITPFEQLEKGMG